MRKKFYIICKRNGNEVKCVNYVTNAKYPWYLSDAITMLFTDLSMAEKWLGVFKMKYSNNMFLARVNSTNCPVKVLLSSMNDVSDKKFFRARVEQKP